MQLGRIVPASGPPNSEGGVDAPSKSIPEMLLCSGAPPTHTTVVDFIVARVIIPWACGLASLSLD